MTDLKPSLEESAQALMEEVQTLMDYYRTSEYPAPSFATDSPALAVPEKAPRDVKIARDSAMNSALKIFDLLAGPSQFLSNLTVTYQSLACLRWLCHFNILKLVPLQGDISFDELATAANVPKNKLKSIARMAMTARLFYEPTPEHIAHTATSALLATNQPLHDWALYICKEAVAVALNMVEATEKWPDSTETNQTAFNITVQTDLPFFAHLKTRPEQLRLYSEYQKAVAGTEGLDLQHLVHGYDWQALGKAQIVDVGGSIGLASVALATAYPDLNFVVQELPDVIKQGKEYISGIKDESITSRITYETHNFFDDQPIVGADVYLLRMILHYWSIEESVNILRKLVSVLKPNHSRILVMDTVLPSPDSVTTVTERQLRTRDLAMLQIHNSGERNVEDWEAIYKKADPRIRMKSVHLPFGSQMSVMELVLEE
nr:FunK [Talaromyces coalescens]